MAMSFTGNSGLGLALREYMTSHATARADHEEHEDRAPTPHGDHQADAAVFFGAVTGRVLRAGWRRRRGGRKKRALGLVDSVVGRDEAALDERAVQHALLGTKVRFRFNAARLRGARAQEKRWK